MTEMWYYTSQGKQMPPLTLAELKRLVGDGVVKPSDMVWKEGLPRWVRAGSAKELHADASTAPVASAATPANDARTNRYVEGVTTRPQRGPMDDADRTARGTTVKRGGSNTGTIVFLIFGALVLVGVLAGAVFLVINLSKPRDPTKPATVKSRKLAPINPDNLINGETKYEVRLEPDTGDIRKFSFRKGIRYAFTVKTEPKPPGKGVDVDLYVLDSHGNEETKEDGEDADCYREWTPDVDGEYQVKIYNQNQDTRNFPGPNKHPPPNITVTCVVTIREKPDRVVDDPVDFPLPDGVLEGKGITDVPLIGAGQEQVFRYRVKAGHKASFSVTPLGAKGEVDFNLVVVKDSDPKTVIAEDNRPAARANVEFTLKATEIVQVKVINAGKLGAAKGALTYDVSP